MISVLPWATVVRGRGCAGPAGIPHVLKLFIVAYQLIPMGFEHAHFLLEALLVRLFSVAEALGSETVVFAASHDH